MRRLALLLALLGVLCAPPALGVATAGEPEDRSGRIVAIEGERARLDAERLALERRFQRKNEEIRRLKGQRPSWNRDRKLERHLAESKDIATILRARQSRLAELGRRAMAERTALLAAIDRELAGNPPAARRAELSRLRAATAARLPRRPRKIKVADETIHPLDDPEDLDAKAAALARSEQQLREEENALLRRIATYQQQAKLAKSRRRADEADVFADDQPRRQTGQVRGGRVGTNYDTGTLAPTAPGLEADDGEPAADLTVTYADVVQPATLDALRSAERSTDPEVRARAAERARADLKARADKLRERRLEIERRAKKLRESGG